MITLQDLKKVIQERKRIFLLKKEKDLPVELVSANHLVESKEMKAVHHGLVLVGEKMKTIAVDIVEKEAMNHFEEKTMKVLIQRSGIAKKVMSFMAIEKNRVSLKKVRRSQKLPLLMKVSPD